MFKDNTKAARAIVRNPLWCAIPLTLKIFTPSSNTAIDECCSALMCNPYPNSKFLLSRFIIRGPICNSCPDLKSLLPNWSSLQQFEISLPRLVIPALICNSGLDLKSLLPRFEISLPQFVIFLPRSEIPKASRLFNPSCPDL